MKCLLRIGAYRIVWQSGVRTFAVRKGGGATAWPWRQLTVPWIGSFVLGRTRPRPMLHVPRADRLHLIRADPTQDVGPCDCSIGVDHDGPPVLQDGETS